MHRLHDQVDPYIAYLVVVGDLRSGPVFLMDTAMGTLTPEDVPVPTGARLLGVAHRGCGPKAARFARSGLWVFPDDLPVATVKNMRRPLFGDRL